MHIYRAEQHQNFVHMKLNRNYFIPLNLVSLYCLGIDMGRLYMKYSKTAISKRFK